MNDPQIAANQMIIESTHPIAGAMRQPRPAARFDATPAELRSFAPALGEHTGEVLREAGFDEDQIGELQRAGTIQLAQASTR